MIHAMNTATNTPTPAISFKRSRWKAPIVLLGTAALASTLFAAGVVPRLIHRGQLEKTAATAQLPIVGRSLAAPSGGSRTARRFVR